MPENLLQKSIEKDISWDIAGDLPDKTKLILDRFLDFLSKRNCHRIHEKIYNLLLVNDSQSSEYPIYKAYLHFLVEAMELP